MAFEGQNRIVARHAFTVIRDAYEAPAAGFYCDFKTRGAGIDCIFQELFDHRCRTFDNFSGGNLVGKRVRENSYLRHGR